MVATGSVESMIVAERLVDLLCEAGVEVVFGIGGTHSLQLLGALERSGTVRFVSARNEQGAAYMAVGYARATRRPAVLVTSTGPGALNALSGIADAAWSSLPVLHVTTFADDGPFSAGIHESPAQTRVMGEVGGAVARVVDGDVDGPFWASWWHCAGALAAPATLEIYSKAWNVPAVPAGERAPSPTPPSEPAPRLLELATRLNSSDAPVVFAGGGVIRSGAESRLVQLAERLDAPILTSIQGRGVATWDHPLYVGPWSSEPAARQLVADSDICLVVGSKLSALSTSHWTVPFPTPTYRIDLGRSGHGKYSGVVDLRLDACQALDELGTLVDPVERGAAKRVSALSSSVRMELLDRAPMEASFIAALDSALPAGTAVSFDMNKASFWFTKYLPCRPGVTQSFSSYLCMGSAIPNAIGMAERGSGLSVAVVGDGGLQMSVAELATLAERRTRVAVVVLVDGRYGLLRDTGSSVAVRGSRRLGIELWNPDFADLAHTFGLTHRLCGTAEQLAADLNDCEGPTLIEVPQDFGRNW